MAVGPQLPRQALQMHLRARCRTKGHMPAACPGSLSEHTATSFRSTFLPLDHITNLRSHLLLVGKPGSRNLEDAATAAGELGPSPREGGNAFRMPRARCSHVSRQPSTSSMGTEGHCQTTFSQTSPFTMLQFTELTDTS